MFAFVTRLPPAGSPGAIAVIEAAGKMDAEPTPTIGIAAMVAPASMRSGGLAPPGTTRTRRPARSDVVDEIVCVASVRLTPDPATLPIGSSITLQGSIAVPLPLTAVLLAPSRPAKCPSHATIGGVL